jgi:outer membrane protein
LTLQEAVERALCNNPDTRTAWATIEARAADVGVSKAAYLPTLSASGQIIHDDSVTSVLGHPELSSNYSTPVRSDNLQLGWVLYDFGGRRAALENAKALLTAALASDDATLQQTFADTAKVYYEAQAAHEHDDADNAIVQDAQDTLLAARNRVAHGAAPQTEAYQAETSFDQAVLTQTRDRGQEQAILGSLANMLALSPDTPLQLDALDNSVQPDETFKQSVSQLINEAVESNPAVMAAEKELQAAEASVTASKAQGRPSIELVGQYSQNNQPVQLGLGLPHYPATGHDGYIGIQVNVPLFTGFNTTYRVRQAEAQVDLQAIALDKARQQVALQVWQSYQTLQTDTQNLTTSVQLQEVANQAWQSAQRRYRSGVGTILELLNTQTALAQARQQRVEALTAWRYDRLALASALGKLRLNNVASR